MEPYFADNHDRKVNYIVNRTIVPGLTQTQVNVLLNAPGSDYMERVNQLDLGVARIIHARGSIVLTPQVDIFNAMNGKERLLFYDNPNGRQVDVFVSSFRMCHEIPLEKRLGVDEDTVPLAELLLTKLQIIELNEKDVRDTVALLLEHEVIDDDTGVNSSHIAELCAEDWGLWRTITRNLETLRARLDAYEVDRDLVSNRVSLLLERIEAKPKSRTWRIRAKVGERKRWYQLPEEV